MSWINRSCRSVRILVFFFLTHKSDKMCCTWASPVRTGASRCLCSCAGHAIYRLNPRKFYPKKSENDLTSSGSPFWTCFFFHKGMTGSFSAISLSWRTLFFAERLKAVGLKDTFKKKKIQKQTSLPCEPFGEKKTQSRPRRAANSTAPP